MASICGVCQTQPSKYKCPKCDLPYCSLVCYKPHKETHANDVPVERPVAQALPVEPTQPSSSSAPRIFGSKKPNFASLENDTDLINLMVRYPHLRIQLQSIYGLTLEPPPADPEQQRSFEPSRGRGRGRGRGGWRGGRGRGGFHQQQPRQSQWTQARGDKEAGEALKRMRDREGDDEGLGEFFRLVTIKFGKGENEANTG